MGSGHFVQSFAIGAFLKTSRLLLKEQIKISVVVKQIAKRLLYFFRSKSQRVVQLAIICKKKQESTVPYFLSVVAFWCLSTDCCILWLANSANYGKVFKDAHTSVKTTTTDFLQKMIIAICYALHRTLYWTPQESCQLINILSKQCIYLSFSYKNWLNCCLFSLKMFVKSRQNWLLFDNICPKHSWETGCWACFIIVINFETCIDLSIDSFN